MIKKQWSDVEAQTVTTEGAEGATVRRLIDENTGADNFYMRLFELQDGGNTPFHDHDWEHEVFVLEGKAQVVTDQGPTPVNAGDFIFVKPGEKHQFVNNSGSVVRFLCLIPAGGKK